MRVIRIGKKIAGIRRVAAVFQGYQGVLLIASHVVRVRHAPGGIDLPCRGIDEFRLCLMNGTPVFPELFPFQLARVFSRGADFTRAPSAVADVVFHP